MYVYEEGKGYSLKMKEGNLKWSGQEVGGRSQSGWSGICTLDLNPGRAVLICQINHSRYPRDNRSARLEGNVLRKSPYSIPQFGKNKQITTASNYGSQNNAGIFSSTLLLFQSS